MTDTMRRDVLRLGPVFLALILIAVGGFFWERTPSAPAFTLPIVAGADVGDRVALESLRGRVVLLEFWASWCRPCQRSAPIFSDIADDYRDRGVLVYGITSESLPIQPIQQAHARFGSRFPSLGDEGGEVGARYDVTNLPTYLLIDPEGNIVFRQTGVPNDGELRARIDAIVEQF